MYIFLEDEKIAWLMGRVQTTLFPVQEKRLHNRLVILELTFVVVTSLKFTGQAGDLRTTLPHG